MKFLKKIWTALAVAVVLSGVITVTVAPQVTEAAAMSDYLENKLIDALLRNTSYTMPTNVYVANNASITFPSPTANWGTISEVCVFDASTSGNLLFRTSLTVSKTVNNGDAAPSFAAAALTFQMDN